MVRQHKYVVPCWTHGSSIADVVCHRVDYGDIDITAVAAKDIFVGELHLHVVVQTAINTESVCRGLMEVESLIVKYVFYAVFNIA